MDTLGLRRCRVERLRVRIAIISLQKFNFTLQHIPGPFENSIADFLSRIHFNKPFSMNGSWFTLDDDDSQIIICSLDGIALLDFISTTSQDDYLIMIQFFS